MVNRHRPPWSGQNPPGALVAREAGAVVTDARGAPWTPQADSFVAAAPSLHADVLRALAPVG